MVCQMLAAMEFDCDNLEVLANDVEASKPSSHDRSRSSYPSRFPRASACVLVRRPRTELALLLPIDNVLSFFAATRSLPGQSSMGRKK